MNLSWRQVEVFRSVMSAGSVTKAAALLRTSQPTVSREIAQLERALGFSLFERRSRKLFATDKGLQFFDEVKQCYAGLRQLEDSGEAIRDSLGRKLEAACLPMLSQTLVPRALARFLSTQPSERVSVHVLGQDLLLKDLIAGRFAFGVIQIGAAVEGTVVEEIEIGEEVAVLPHSHPLASKKVISPADLRRERFITFPQEDFFRGRFDSLLEESGGLRQLRLEVSTAEAVCSLVGAGLGVAIVNPITARSFEARGILVRRLSVSIPFTLGLCKPRGYIPTPEEDLFADCFLGECRAMQKEFSRSKRQRKAD